MNGRLYDPILGCFLSPDNYVQQPDNSQNFNRYSYCLNNPLKYTDPSGELFGIDDMFLVGMLVHSAIVGAVSADMNGQNPWIGGLKGFASTGLSMVGTAGIGQLLGHAVGSFGNELLRAGMHGLNQGVISAINGNGFGSGFATGALSSLIASGAQSLNLNENAVLTSSTAVGALSSLCFGNDWMSGAMAGLEIGSFNHTWKISKDGSISCTLDDIYIMGHDKRITSLYYTASMVTNTLSKGYLRGFDKNGSMIFHASAVSGSQNKSMTIPQGAYHASQFIDTTDPKFSRNGVGFKVVIGPDPYDKYLNRVRTYLRIHPARSGITEGCIGLVSDDVEELRHLENLFKSALKNNSVPLYVTIFGR